MGLGSQRHGFSGARPVLARGWPRGAGNAPRGLTDERITELLRITPRVREGGRDPGSDHLSLRFTHLRGRATRGPANGWPEVATWVTNSGSRAAGADRRLMRPRDVVAGTSIGPIGPPRACVHTAHPPQTTHAVQPVLVSAVTLEQVLVLSSETGFSYPISSACRLPRASPVSWLIDCGPLARSRSQSGSTMSRAAWIASVSRPKSRSGSS